MREGEVCDKVSCLNRRDEVNLIAEIHRRGNSVCVDLVLLANGAASYKVVDVHRETWSLEITLDNSLSPEASKMAKEGG